MRGNGVTLPFREGFEWFVKNLLFTHRQVKTCNRLIWTVNRLYCCTAMIRFSLMLAALTMFTGQNSAQTTGSIVVYRERGKNFGLIHYAEGEHPTLSCDGLKVARLRERHRVTISVGFGPHDCVAIERQYPGEFNVDSQKASVEVKANGTIYLRLRKPFGNLHFVLQEVPEETGAAESAKMEPVKSGDSYTTVLPVIPEKKSSSQ